MTDRVYETECVVVGSGPGGATIANELSKAGVDILLLEKGKDHRDASYYGSYLGPLLYTDKASFLYTEEGLNVIRPMMVGGATSMFCGSAARPPAWFESDYGIELESEADETIEELGIEPLPSEHRGEASTRVAEAAQQLGFDWQPTPKFMRPAESQDFDCDANCMLGCPCGAKWNAGQYVDAATDRGARLLTGADVEKVIEENRECTGVKGAIDGETFRVEASRVVLSAGGLGSPRILQRSGWSEAGNRMAMDTTVMVYGVTDKPGIGGEPPMTWSWRDPDGRVMLSTLIDPWLLFPVMAARRGLGPLLSWSKWSRIVGIMIKLTDDLSGGIDSDGSIRKPLTDADAQRLGEAENIAQRILVEVGAEPQSIFTTPQRGTHPSATVRIGELVDTNLETRLDDLYVCDASVFPRALGRPTVLTIVSLARRLASYLDS